MTCNSALSKPQCDKPVDTGLYCPCTRFVEQTASLDVVRQQWADALCPKISPPGPCTGQPCPKPGPLLCINDTCQ